ncbi:hypothetical protein DFH09DRAFT_470716 [Mycena vulgaris]|nr:hypothetical protein DFH09DRAFT_470716 [Mycena vulgaris]
MHGRSTVSSFTYVRLLGCRRALGKQVLRRHHYPCLLGHEHPGARQPRQNMGSSASVCDHRWRAAPHESRRHQSLVSRFSWITGAIPRSLVLFLHPDDPLSPLQRHNFISYADTAVSGLPSLASLTIRWEPLRPPGHLDARDLPGSSTSCADGETSPPPSVTPSSQVRPPERASAKMCGIPPPNHRPTPICWSAQVVPCSRSLCV